MSALHGLLGINDTDRVFVSTVGQRAVYDAITQMVARYNAEINQMLSLFVERTTENFKLRYKLPGGGKLQRTGRQAPPGAVKRYGHYEIALPLEGFGAQIAGSRVDMAYMTVTEVARHLDSIFIQDTNTLRWEILHALMDENNATFTDPLHGDLTIRRLANTDGSLYPPVQGSEAEADDDHYNESGYTVANITTDNMPLKTLRDELVEHFGGISTGGDPIVVMTDATTGDKLKAVCAAAGTWFDYKDMYTAPGVDTDLMRPAGMPNAPGYCIGRAHGCWVFVWNGWMPSTYMLGIHTAAPAPLLMRVDPADTGLPQGLALVTEDENYPLLSSYWSHRFGLGCGNRLSAAVMEIADGGAYTNPSAYD